MKVAIEAAGIAPGLERQPPEPVADRAGMQRRAVLADKHQPGSGPRLPPREPLGGLAGQVRA
jgi:hypothetical protein